MERSTNGTNAAPGKPTIKPTKFDISYSILYPN